MITIDSYTQIASFGNFVQDELCLPCLHGLARSTAIRAEQIGSTPTAIVHFPAIFIPRHFRQTERTGGEAHIADAVHTPQINPHLRRSHENHLLPMLQVGRHVCLYTFIRLQRSDGIFVKRLNDQAIQFPTLSHVQVKTRFAKGPYVAPAHGNGKARGSIAVKQITVPNLTLFKQALTKERVTGGLHLRNSRLSRAFQRTYFQCIIVGCKASGIVQSFRVIGNLLADLQISQLAIRRQRQACPLETNRHLAPVQ